MSSELALLYLDTRLHALASFLREQGAESATVADIDYVFTRDNPLYAKLEKGLGT